MDTAAHSIPRPRAVAPGVFHQPFGRQAEAWFLDDGRYEADPARDCAWNAEPGEVWSCLAAAGLANAPLRLRVTPVLLRWQGQFVLLDAGCADAYGPGLGLTGRRLDAIRVQPEQIDIVLFSHLHLDHIAGAVAPGGTTLQFPRARLLADQREWAFWRQPTPDASGTRLTSEQVAGIVSKIQTALSVLSSRIELFSPGDEVLPGIRAIATPGHTPHHVAFECAFEENELVYAGDAFVEPALQVTHPEWRTSGDMAPHGVASSRRSLLARAAERGQWFSAYHFPLPGLGTVRETPDGGFAFHLARWDWADV